MVKHLSRNKWIKIFNVLKESGIIEAIALYKKLHKTNKPIKYYSAYCLIRRNWILFNNIGMIAFKKRKGPGRPHKKIDNSDIPSIIDSMNEEQKREVIEDWIKIQREKRDKQKLMNLRTFTIELKAKVSHYHRTAFYKKLKKRTYKFDYIKNNVFAIFEKSKKIYGSERIAEELLKLGICINARTLRYYMRRWDIKTKTRIAKRKAECKDIAVNIKDKVQRDYNQKFHEKTILCSDVSYIPAKVLQNNIYLSIILNHKTKKIESWCLSLNNDNKLVLDTIRKINKTNFIFHTDHGVQYSSHEVLSYLKQLNAEVSMSRVANSLDNREAEYFFSCLKGEFLKQYNTNAMNFNEIYKLINEYIDWYNTQRIQSILGWKTPAEASAYVI